MSLISRLGCVAVLGAGGGVSLALGAFNGEQDEWGKFVFTKTGGA